MRLWLLCLFLTCVFTHVSYAEIKVESKLALPFATGPQLITGCIDENWNKGYSVVNTTSGMLALRFTLNPLSFSHPEDDIIQRPGLQTLNGLLLDPQTQILYFYGSNVNVTVASIAGIESYNVSEGVDFSLITTFSELSTDSRGYLSAFVNPTSSDVLVNLFSIDVTIMYELNLQEADAEIIHRKEFTNLKQPYYPFTTLLSSQNPIEIVLATEGENMSETPQLVALNPNYPWLLQQYGSISQNGSLFQITSCNELGLVLALQRVCDEVSTICGDYYLVVMDEKFVELDLVLLVGQIGTENPRTTLSCSPVENLVVVSVDNNLFLVDLDTMLWETMLFYTYQEIVWAQSSASDGFIYVGLNPLGSNAATTILQISY